MAKKTQPVYGADSWNAPKPSTRQPPFYNHTKTHTKSHSTDQRVTVGLRFGRGVASYLKDVFAQHQIP